MSEHDADRAQHEIDRADDHVGREQWERERNCAHRTVVIHTYCRDCGAVLPNPPETATNEPTRGTES
jgi:hypothetical protein